MRSCHTVRRSSVFLYLTINAVVNKEDKIRIKTTDTLHQCIVLDPSGALSDVFFFSVLVVMMSMMTKSSIFFFFFFFFCDRGDDVDDDKEFDLSSSSSVIAHFVV